MAPGEMDFCTVTLRLYAELRDPPSGGEEARERTLRLARGATVSECLDALALSRERVDLILVNGASAGFSKTLSEGDRLTLYPVFESFDISPIQRLRGRPLRRPRFVLDVHLGKLAHLLRMLGFDALYWNDAGDERLLAASLNEGRILLSKDRALLSHPSLERGHRILSSDPAEQLRAAVDRFDLRRLCDPFTRCMLCNTPLREAPKWEVIHRLPPKVREAYDVFKECPACGRIYWNGSHVERMTAYIGRLFGEAA